jgi:hypothetical protein
MLETASMETNAERRRRKLIELCKKHGGYTAVAEKAGVTPATLDQVIKGVLLPAKQDGSRSPRALGNANAHAIEDAFGLGRGWFDAVETVDENRARLSDQAVTLGMLYDGLDAVGQAKMRALLEIATGGITAPSREHGISLTETATPKQPARRAAR